MFSSAVAFAAVALYCLATSFFHACRSLTLCFVTYPSLFPDDVLQYFVYAFIAVDTIAREKLNSSDAPANRPSEISLLSRSKRLHTSLIDCSNRRSTKRIIQPTRPGTKTLRHMRAAVLPTYSNMIPGFKLFYSSSLLFTEKVYKNFKESLKVFGKIKIFCNHIHDRKEEILIIIVWQNQYIHLRLAIAKVWYNLPHVFSIFSLSFLLNVPVMLDN